MQLYDFHLLMKMRCFWDNEFFLFFALRVVKKMPDFSIEFLFGEKWIGLKVENWKVEKNESLKPNLQKMEGS